MNFVRSLMFAFAFYGGTIFLGVAYLPLLLLPDRAGQPFFQFWIDYTLICVRFLAGIRVQVIYRSGAEMPDGPAIFASKHQSAWETLAFNRIVHKPAFVLKQELLKIPFFGWYLSKMRQVPVDRAAGAAAMRAMVANARAATEDGHSLVIYPQGTRVAPGVQAAYHPGVYALYKSLDLPVVPVALNSGRLWARNGFLKRAGTVTVSILPAIPPGLPRKDFMIRLESAVEEETMRLENTS